MSQAQEEYDIISVFEMSDDEDDLFNFLNEESGHDYIETHLQ